MKNRTVTGQRSENKRARFPKTDQRYWQGRLKKRKFRNTSGQWMEIPEWQVRLFHGGKDVWFNLDTPVKAAATVRARNIYMSLLSNGWEAALEKYKPKTITTVESPTVGEFLDALEQSADLRPKTFKLYANRFRRIVAGIIGFEGNRSKFDYVGGGRQRWLKRVSAVKLEKITPAQVSRWRNAYIKKAGSDHLKRTMAIHSANSFINNGKCLFAPKHLETIGHLTMPNPLPFMGIKLTGGRSSRYHSEIDPGELLFAAQRELAVALPPKSIDREAWRQAKRDLSLAYRFLGNGRKEQISCCYKRIYSIEHAREIAKSKNEQFKIFLLALGAGLRRNEIDKLEWKAILWDRCIIRIRTTRFFEPKSSASAGDVDVDPQLMEFLKGYRKKADGPFVINGNRPHAGQDYYGYRCAGHFKELSSWLRTKGITANKPIHTLRKEFGSIICQRAGIFAASEALRHANLQITADSYLAKKESVAFPISELLSKPLIRAISA